MVAPLQLRVCSARLGESTAYVRQQQLTLGRAMTFDSLDAKLSAVETFASATAADLLDTFRRVTKERRLLVDEIEASVTAELDNALVHLGVVGEEGSPALKSLHIKAYASSFASESELSEAWRSAQLRSPLITTLQKAASVEATLQIVH
jgi:hypothetical protein